MASTSAEDVGKNIADKVNQAKKIMRQFNNRAEIRV